MIRKIAKDQKPKRKMGRTVGALIDCLDVVIFIFPPPREHGKAHCHVTSKKRRKVKGEKREVYPEVKIFLDGSDLIVLAEGFTERDLQTIAEVIFNDPVEGEISNDEFLKKVWETLHGQSEES